MNTNTARASWSSRHEPVKPGNEIVWWKVWILVGNSDRRTFFVMFFGRWLDPVCGDLSTDTFLLRGFLQRTGGDE